MPCILRPAPRTLLNLHTTLSRHVCSPDFPRADRNCEHVRGHGSTPVAHAFCPTASIHHGFDRDIVRAAGGVMTRVALIKLVRVPDLEKRHRPSPWHLKKILQHVCLSRSLSAVSDPRAVAVCLAMPLAITQEESAAVHSLGVPLSQSVDLFLTALSTTNPPMEPHGQIDQKPLGTFSLVASASISAAPARHLRRRPGLVRHVV